MVGQIGIRFEGIGNVNRILTQMPKKIRDETDATTEDLANEIAFTARKRAPVDTGLLRRSIGVKKMKTGRGHMVVAGGGVRRRQGPKLSKGFYPKHQEYGYESHFVATEWMDPSSPTKIELETKNIYGIVAMKHTPYLKPAYERAKRTLRMKAKKLGQNIVKTSGG